VSTVPSERLCHRTEDCKQTTSSFGSFERVFVCAPKRSQLAGTCDNFAHDTEDEQKYVNKLIE
jgi:hypothetical protein